MDREACAACRMGLARCAIAVGRRDAARARLHSGRSGRLALGARLRPRKLPGQIDPSAVFARTGRLAAGRDQRRPDALDRASAPGKRRRPTELPQPAFDETTCDLSGVAPELRPRLRCGTVSVPRSYDDPDAGRFILVDQRGTGRSEPSLCPDLERKLLETTLALVAGVTEQALAPAPGRLFGLPRSGDQPRLRSEGFRNKGNGRGFRLGEGYQSP